MTSHIILRLNQILHLVDNFAMLDKLRILGSILIVSSHFIMLHIDIKFGVLTHLIADFCTLPYFINKKMWDMIIMLSFLAAIGISKLVSV